VATSLFSKQLTFSTAPVALGALVTSVLLGQILQQPRCRTTESLCLPVAAVRFSVLFQLHRSLMRSPDVHGNPFSTVDIFNATSRTWRTASLSVPRFLMASTSLPNFGIALFSGGMSALYGLTDDAVCWVLFIVFSYSCYMLQMRAEQPSIQWMYSMPTAELGPLRF
jgi:hypothetical protein